MADDDDTGTATAAAEGGDGNGGEGGDVVPAGAGADLPEPQSGVLSLAQLIGAPIHALVDAEAQSAMATARFIRTVGFTGDGEGMGDLGDLQMARFTRKRRNTEGLQEEIDVEIPLLSMLPIPALQIKDAELDYTVKIIQTEAIPSRRGDGNELLPGGELREPPATLRAAFAREPRPGDRRSIDMLVKMKLRIEQADMPAGLGQLLALASESGQQNLRPPVEESDSDEDSARDD